MRQESFRDRGYAHVPRVWALAFRGLVGATCLTACSTQRVDLCSTVHTRIQEELRSSEEMAGYVQDPWECEKNARRLHELAKELHGLDIPDAPLHKMVEAYGVEVEHLAEDYDHLAAVNQSGEALPPEKVERERDVLNRGVLGHQASVNALRDQVQNACGNF